MAALDEEMKMWIKAYDEYQGVLSRFSGALENVEKAEKAVAASTNEVNRQIQIFGESIQKTGPPTEQLTRKTREKSAADKEAKEAAKAHAEELKAKAKAEQEAARATEEHKQKVDGLLQAFGAMGILAAVKRGLQEVTDAGAALDKELGIQTGLTGQVRDVTLEFVMGLERQQKGVTELTLGLNELARAGIDAEQGMKALPELSVFATAAMGDLEKTMAPVVTILKVFQKDAAQTGEITDVLTMAANRSALGFDDFQLALAMSAGVAKMSGMEYQELIAVLSVMRDAGLGASDGGTSLKSALMALMNPSTEATKIMKELNIQVYDANGRMKSWADIVANMEQALAPLNEQSRNLAMTTIFGSDGVRAMALSMGRGSEYIRAMTADLKDSRGATAELAHEMGNTFNGAVQRTQANLEKMKVTVFEDLKGAAAGLLGALDTLVVGFNSLSGAGRGLLEVMVGGAGITAAVAAVAVLVRATLVPAFEGLIAMLVKTGVVAQATGTAMNAAFGWVGLAAIAVIALTSAIVAYVGAQEKARLAAEQKAQSLMTLSDRYEELQRTMDSAASSEAERIRAGEEQKRLIEDIGDEFPQLVRRWNEHGEAVELDTRRLEENTKAARENMRAKAEGELSDLQSQIKSLQDTRAEIQNQMGPAAKRAENPFWWRTLNIAMGGTLIGDMAGGTPIPMDQGALAGQLKEVSGQIDEALAKAGRLHAIVYGTGKDFTDEWQYTGTGGKGDGTLNTDPQAAEKARVAAIREQMDLMRHLMAMDDARVDTAQEQLGWLQQIRAALGTTRELEEAIYGLEKEIAREPLQQQLAAFSQRRQLGELSTRQEQLFYEQLVANAETYRLTQQEVLEYQIQAAVLRKKADKEAYDTLMSAARYNIDLTDATTAQQLDLYRTLMGTYAEGSEERKRLALEVHQLEKKLQAELHDQHLAEIEFDSVIYRWGNDQKLSALQEYLATATNLTIEQQRDLQKTIAQMQQQSERDHQGKLLDFYRAGLESQRRAQEIALRQRQADAEDAKRLEIQKATDAYEAKLAPLRHQLETMQAQTKELERQNRLLDLQKRLQEKDQAIADAKAIRNRVVIEAGGALGFTIRRTYDEAKVAELEKERTKIVDDIQQEQAKQEREREEERLQNRIALLEKERDARLKTLNEELADLRTKHGEQLEQFNLWWQERLSTQTLQLDLEKTAWKTHYSDVLKETETWVTDMNKALAGLQRPSLDSAADLVRNLGGTVAPPAGSGAGGTSATPNNGSGGGAAPVNVTNYGTNHYYGVDGVIQGMAALAAGFSQNLKK